MKMDLSKKYDKQQHSWPSKIMVLRKLTSYTGYFYKGCKEIGFKGILKDAKVLNLSQLIKDNNKFS